MEYLGLPLLTFTDKAQLRRWLQENHRVSPGIWVRVYKTKSKIPSASFEDVLDQRTLFWMERKSSPPI